jgi:FkbM family methyltransferase
MFGKKKFYRFFLILKNIGLEGMNYRNTDLNHNGELALIQKIKTYYKNEKELILFDVGANVGNYSNALLNCFDKNCSIYAFEPFSEPYKALNALALQHPQLKVFQLGLSNKEEELTIYSNSEFSEVGGIYNRDSVLNSIKLDRKELNRFTRLDTFCSENKIDHIHFLKIDVEGHELAVLEGAKQLLDRGAINLFQFEFGSGNYFSKTFLLDFFNLLQANYVICRLMKDGLHPLNTYETDQDMLVLCNYVAVNKTLASDFLDKHA